MVVKLDVHWNELLLPVLLSIVAVMIARAISVYGVIIPFNRTKKEEVIPLTWQHLLAW